MRVRSGLGILLVKFNRVCFISYPLTCIGKGWSENFSEAVCQGSHYLTISWKFLWIKLHTKYIDYVLKKAFWDKHVY